MALQKTMEIQNNLGLTSTIDNAYVKVERVDCSKTSNTIEIGVYLNDKSKKVQINFYGFVYDLDGANPIKQAYEHLKTLPEFADATDV